MKNALITGAAGSIGSHIEDQCLRLCMAVTAVDDVSGGCNENVPSGARFVRTDLRHPAAAAALWHGKRYRYVYDVAAYAAEGLSHFIRRYNYETNLIASINLINHTGIRAEEPPPKLQQSTGHSPAKRGGSLPQRNRDLHEPGDEPPSHDAFGHGQQTRACTHIDDIISGKRAGSARATCLSAGFNIGADMPHTILKLAYEVAQAFGVDPRIEHLPPRNEVVHAFASHEKARRVLGHDAQIPLAVGVRRMLRWERDRGPTRAVSIDAVEVERKLPPSRKAVVA